MNFEKVAAKIAAHGKGRPKHAERKVGWDAVQGHVERMTQRATHGRAAIAKGHHASWASVSRSVTAHDHAAKRLRD